MKYAIPLFLTLSVCLYTGCGDGDSSKDNDTCTANVCKDLTTLNVCEGDHYREELCGSGKKCSVDQCVPDSPQPEMCTANQCKDAETLKICEGGTYREEPCGSGKKCSVDQCVLDSPQPEICTANQCKDAETLKICEGGTYREEPCGNGKKCETDQCVVDEIPPEPGETCEKNACKNDTTQKLCSGGTYLERACESGEKCVDGECVPGPGQCTFHECTGELSQTYHACVNGSISAAESTCGSGKLCVYGSCVDAFEEKTFCDGEEGAGYCTADKAHAVVCNAKHQLAIWTCADECIENNGIVDCPKKPRPKPHECEKDYKAECISNNSQVKVCVDYQIVTWDCYEGTCSVDANNAITCPKNAGVAGLGGLESGGTYGDMCNVKKYQEACIDKYYARICDKDGFVRIKPAGDCKVSKANPLKVEYTHAAACDTSNYMPFCINNGKAIGFCAYDGDDLSVGIYKAAQCPTCQSLADAEACMYL